MASKLPHRSMWTGIVVAVLIACVMIFLLGFHQTHPTNDQLVSKDMPAEIVP